MFQQQVLLRVVFLRFAYVVFGSKCARLGPAHYIRCDARLGPAFLQRKAWTCIVASNNFCGGVRFSVGFQDGEADLHRMRSGRPPCLPLWKIPQTRRVVPAARLRPLPLRVSGTAGILKKHRNTRYPIQTV